MRKSPSCFQQAGKSLRWAKLYATLVWRFFLSSKGFIIVVPVAKGAKTAPESVIEFGRPERISVRDTCLNVQYWLNITREFLVLLVKTDGISYIVYDHLLPYVRCLGFIGDTGLLMREVVTFMHNRNCHARASSHYISKKAWGILT